MEEKIYELERRVANLERKLRRLEEAEIREERYRQQSGRVNLSLRLLVYAVFFIALFAMLYYYRFR
ncbi:MAG: hypothetical protein ACUVWP_04445 [bacterium]